MFWSPSIELTMTHVPMPPMIRITPSTRDPIDASLRVSM
jgi:hypothetical protein